LTSYRRRWSSFDAAWIGLCGGAVAMAFLLTPGADLVALWGWSIPEVCAVKRTTGWSCPGCGLTRSWTYLAHGDVKTAFAMNWLGPVLFLAAAIQIPWTAARMWRSRRSGGEDACQS
jgi:hypothetical protein